LHLKSGKMELTIPQEKHYKYLAILQVLASITKPLIKPFNKLRKRELEVFAILLYMYNEKYKSLEPEERNVLIFSYQTRVEITKILGDVSMDSIYNIMMNLRKQGLITKDSIVPQYLLPSTNYVKLNFTTV